MTQRLYWWWCKLVCFVVGHDWRTGYPENYEPDYCYRCGKEERDGVK
jgi:hypothetical protein